MPDEGGEEESAHPEGEDEEAGTGSPGSRSECGTTPPEPVRVTPVKVVRWVPRAAGTQPTPQQGPPDQEELPPPFEESTGETPTFEVLEGEVPPEQELTTEEAPFAVVEEEARPPFEEVGDEGGATGGGGQDELPTPFEVAEGSEAEAPAFVAVEEEDGHPAPFAAVEEELLSEGTSPGTAPVEAPFTVVEDETPLRSDGDGPIEEEVEMEHGIELREEESTVGLEVIGRGKKPRPEPPQPQRGATPAAVPGGPAPAPAAPTARVMPAGPITPPRPAEPARPGQPPLMRQPTIKGIPITSPKQEPMRAPPRTTVSGAERYFRPDEDAVKGPQAGPPTGFDRDSETEAGETDAGIELVGPTDRRKKEKSPQRAAPPPKKAQVGGHDSDAEVGTRDLGPDIGVDEKRKKRRF